MRGNSRCLATAASVRQKHSLRVAHSAGSRRASPSPVARTPYHMPRGAWLVGMGWVNRQSARRTYCNCSAPASSQSMPTPMDPQCRLPWSLAEAVLQQKQKSKCVPCHASALYGTLLRSFCAGSRRSSSHSVLAGILVSSSCDHGATLLCPCGRCCAASLFPMMALRDAPCDPSNHRRKPIRWTTNT